MQDSKMTKEQCKNNVWLKIWGKSGEKCSWLLEAQLSPNQTITYGYGTLHRYYILSCILVPTGAFEWSLVTKENKGALTKKFHPASCLADFGR